MNKKDLYKHLGGWLAEEKGCKENKYSQGVIFEPYIGNYKPDIFGLNYKIIEGSVPKIQYWVSSRC